MTASNFLACFNETETFEGGDVNNPHDPGGATRKGVTQHVYTAWLQQQGRPLASVFTATDASIQAIYRQFYWSPVRGDDLYDGLDLVVVDSGWGSGPRTAIKWLQQMLAVDADGVFGDETLEAVKANWGSPQLIERLCARRMAFFQSLNTWRWFSKGWTWRLNGIHQRALQMNAAAARTNAPGGAS